MRKTFSWIREYKIGVILIILGICGLTVTLIVQELGIKIDMLAIGTGVSGVAQMVLQSLFKGWAERQERLQERAEKRVISAVGSAAENSVAEIKSSVEEVKNNVSSVKNNVADINKTVTTISNSVMKLAGSQMELAMEVSSLEQTVANNHAEGQKAISSLSSSIETDRKLNMQLHAEHQQVQKELSAKIDEVKNRTDTRYDDLTKKIDHIEQIVVTNSNK